MFNILRILESTLSSLKVTIGRCYYCQDTGNLYIDTKVGRIPQVYTLIRTELERQELLSISTGYYYVYETNTLWSYEEEYHSWQICAQNNINYPSEYVDKNTATHNIIADSFNVLVNQNTNSIGSLVINPEISIEVLDPNRETPEDNTIERVVTSHDFGKMIFNGDICYQKDGKLTVICMDDGCLDDLDTPSEPITHDAYLMCYNNDFFHDYNDDTVMVPQIN